MEAALARSWWTVAVRGAVYVAFGLTAVLWADLTFGILFLLFGIFATVDGILTLIGAIRTGRGKRPWGGMAFEGIVSFMVGVFVLVWPARSALVLLYALGAWALLTGVLEIVAAIRLRREIQGEWLLILGGLLSVAFGVVVFLWPAGGALAIVWALGIYGVLFGALLLVLSMHMRRHLRVSGGQDRGSVS